MNLPTMTIVRVLGAAAFCACCCGAVLAVPPFCSAGAGVGTTTAVFSETSDDYVRSKLPDGSFQGEAYGFGRGGFYGSPSRDETIEGESFMDIARVIARPLADKNFVPTRDPKKARLLIMVYWGVTSGTLDPTSDNFQFQRADRPKSENRSFDLLGPISFQGGLVDLKNAMILGYAGEIAEAHPRLGIINNVKRDDLIDDIEHNRYFVVLMAYDFRCSGRRRSESSSGKRASAFGSREMTSGRCFPPWPNMPRSILVRTAAGLSEGRFLRATWR